MAGYEALPREELLSLLAERDRQIARLEAENADLAARVARLGRLISRNSGNSSMPPSADDLPGRVPPRPSRGLPGQRKPGKQPGTPGSCLAWTADTDETVGHHPVGACRCGAALGRAQDLGVVASYQEVEIPLQTARVIQHDVHEVACGCGRVHRAAPPPGAGAPGTVSYGTCLRAWCVHLMVAHAVPVHRCAELIKALTGARPSAGFVYGMIARAAATVGAANALIRSLIILTRVACADETPIRAGPGPKSRKKHLLVACTPMLTYYLLGDRSMKTFTRFVLGDMSDAVIVHDGYQNYDAFPGLLHQLCCQHLIRDLEDAAETYLGAHWPNQIRQARQGLIHAANIARAQGLPAVPGDVVAPLVRAFRHGVILGLGQVKRAPGRKQEPCRELLEVLRDRQDDVLWFVSDLRVPPTSNQAERDLRPAKTQQKISGRLRSEETTRHRYAIRGYLSTAAKHGISALTALRDALDGNPWMPPIPDLP